MPASDSFASGRRHIPGPGEPTLLPKTALNIQFATWFPDGRRVLLSGNEAGRGSRLFVADIPAVIIYHVFARSVTGHRPLLAVAGAGIERLVSRDLDFRKSARIAQATMAMAAE